MKCFFLILCLVLMSACQPETKSNFNQLSIQRSEILSLKEQRELMPNPLFRAVRDQSEEEVLKQIIDENGQYLLEENKKGGNTPLGFAIESNDLRRSLFLAKQMNPKQYQHQNKEGESYLYLASKKGLVELIQFLSNQFYEKQKEFLIDYEFTDLDLKTKKGERAIHVAKNSAVANALEVEYYRGILEIPLRQFQFLQNNKGQTFLHTAVRDQNSDLLRWGLEEACNVSEGGLAYLWEGLQNVAKIVSLDLDNLINTQDNEGLTALNLASKNNYLEGIHILSSCSWTDYLLKDKEGNIPLQNFLLSLDPLKAEHNKEVKDIFSRLMERHTLLSFNSRSKNINSINNKGENSLHIAARLNDSFFYNQLKIHGNSELKNNEGKSPRAIFEAHQQFIRLY